MTTASAPEAIYYYPNRMGRILLLSLRKELGPDRLHEVLVAAEMPKLTTGLLPNNLEKRFSFDNISALQAATEKVFGARAGRQINYRVGRGAFDLGLRDFDPVLGISDLPMRLTPLSVKLRIGLDVFARVFNQFSDQVVKLAETETYHLWVIERCPVCWKRQTDEPCCQLAGGLLEEALFWGTGGRRFQVEETACIAKGNPTCTFQIEKRPLD